MAKLYPTVSKGGYKMNYKFTNLTGLKKERKSYLFIGIAVLLAVCLSLLLANMMIKKPHTEISTEQREKPVINKDTKIYTEITYSCQGKLKGEIPAQDLLGLDYQSILKRFPKEEGWSIDDSIPNTIKLTKSDKNLCPLHKSYRHLGVIDDRVAVYEGPLGVNNIVLQQENIKLEQLPGDFKQKLNEAMNYDQQPEQLKSELKKQLEFSSETGLNEALENLNEYNR